MKNKSIIIYSVFACAIYFLSIFYFAFNLIYEYSDGSLRTKRRFEHTSISVQESMNKINSSNYNADTIKNLIVTSFGNMNDFAYINFSENGKTIYAYKTNTIAEGSTSRLLSAYDCNFSAGGKNYSFSANLYKLRPSSIFKYGKRSFLVILIVTLITFIYIVVSNLKDIQKSQIAEKLSDNDEENKEITEDADDYEDEETSTEENSEINDENSSEEHEEIPLENKNTEQIEKNDEDEIKEATEETEDSPSEHEELQTNETDCINEPESDAAKQEIPQEIYSKETGLCYEPFLETKLNNEINHSIETEADLSLFLIQIPEIEKNSELYKEICNYISVQFQNKEQIFEYKEDSIAAIKVNCTIDEAITFADKIHAEIKQMINNDQKICYIGITSRTVRMVKADRLLLEADEALEHAKQDTKCPIIAFRVDAEKFRLANL